MATGSARYIFAPNGPRREAGERPVKAALIVEGEVTPGRHGQNDV